MGDILDFSTFKSRRFSSWDEDWPDYDEYVESHRRGDLYNQTHLDALAEAGFHPLNEPGMWERRLDNGDSHYLSYGPGARTNGKLTPWFFSTDEESVATPHQTLRSALRTADEHKRSLEKMASYFRHWTEFGGLL